MKFQKQIAQEKNLAWNEPFTDYYLDYKALKKLIKAIVTSFEKANARRLSVGAPLRQTASESNVAAMAAKDGSKTTPTKGTAEEIPKRFNEIKNFEKKIKNKRTRLNFVVALRKEIIKIENFVRSKLSALEATIEKHRTTVAKLEQWQQVGFSSFCARIVKTVL